MFDDRTVIQKSTSKMPLKPPLKSSKIHPCDGGAVFALSFNRPFPQPTLVRIWEPFDPVGR